MQTLQQMTDRAIALTNQVARELNLLDSHDGGPSMDRAPLRAAVFEQILELVTFTEEEETDDNAKIDQLEG